MASREIWHEIKIKTSPGAVYASLTDVKKLGHWWIPDTRGESRVGGTLEFWLGEFCQAMQVASLQTNERVQWRPTEKGLPDWVGTAVEFKLLPDASQTRVQLRHSGWREGVEGFPYYSLSWAVFLVSLKTLLEKGKGYPFPNDWVP